MIVKYRNESDEIIGLTKHSTVTEYDETMLLIRTHSQRLSSWLLSKGGISQFEWEDGSIYDDDGIRSILIPKKHLGELLKRDGFKRRPHRDGSFIKTMCSRYGYHCLIPSRSKIGIV